VYYFIVSASLQIPQHIFYLLTPAAMRATPKKHFKLAEYTTNTVYIVLI